MLCQSTRDFLELLLELPFEKDRGPAQPNSLQDAAVPPNPVVLRDNFKRLPLPQAPYHQLT